MQVALSLLGCVFDPVDLNPAGAPAPADAVAAPWGTADWTVDCNGGGDFESIQDAIDGAESGDWIMVEPCTYKERLDYNGKSLYIQGRAGPSDTILNATASGYAVSATHGEDSRTALVGFTIMNSRGGAAYADLSSLHFEDVVVTEGVGSYLFVCLSGDLELKNVVTENNEETNAVLYMYRGSVQIDESTLECGRSNYGLYLAHGSSHVDNSTVDCGRSTSVWNTHTTGSMKRTVLTGDVYQFNEDDHPEDQIAFYNSYVAGDISVEYGAYTLVNSIVDGGGISYTAHEEYPGSGLLVNSVIMNGRCGISQDGGTHEVYYTDFWNTTPSCGTDTWVGVNGNIDDDPRFVDESRGDFHLDPRSPLIDAGSNDYSGEDVDGSDNDIGLYGGHFTMDGGW